MTKSTPKRTQIEAGKKTVKGRDILDFNLTSEIKVPKDMMDQVIGQPVAVRRAKIALKQRRNLLLVGPPGIGKSMIAQAMSAHMPPPTQQIDVVNNPQNPQRPLAEVVREDAVAQKKVHPNQVPAYVAEKLGFKCSACAAVSMPEVKVCPVCKADKYRRFSPQKEITTTRFSRLGTEEGVTYRRSEDGIVLGGNAPEQGLRRGRSDFPQRIALVPLKRKTFVHATGASETELLGDVRHDPYGSHPDIGTPPYLRVVPGAIHDAHEGVLFIDELPHLEHLQNFILTAMQEKKFTITGRNPQSAGASVRVEDVPCDFLFVGACNIRDVQDILSPLRSRILGNGYEILLETTMPDTEENQRLIARFVAQEIVKDTKIPHADSEAVYTLMEEARRRAKVIDDARGALTLRLRDLGGVIRTAGDMAVEDGLKLITKDLIKRAIEESKPIEYQLQERYGSVLRGIERDKIISPEYGKMGESYV
ncbi:Archaeal Lon protease [uncultured archaeon]|nr:Archaeal Lon protease [uncultured archaeon]